MFEVVDKKIAIKGRVSVMSLGRYRWIYESTPRVLILSTESGIDAQGRLFEGILFPKNVRWEKPYEDDLIDEEEYELIKSNIREAITALEPNSLVEFHE